MGEGFGLTLAEAAASEVPIVAQDCSSIPEVVGPGGVLVSPERAFPVYAGEDLRLPDVEKFSEEIERMYQFPSLRYSMGKKGREHVLANFSWDNAAKQTNEIAMSVLATEALQVVAKQLQLTNSDAATRGSVT